MPSEPPLAVRNLTVQFETDRGPLTAADNLSFELEEGKTTCLVGESGCGKSVTALALLRLVPPPGRIIGGEISLQGQDILSLPDRELRRLRGREISIIFQEPMMALNPVYTVGVQVSEVLRTHLRLRRRPAKERALQMLDMVGLPAFERYDAYPHELSGGMRQRVMIAVALACRPTVLIADEPTTALDVTIQAQILDLLARLQEDLGMAVLLITHDLSIVAEVADDVVVMYAGEVIEKASVDTIFRDPRHPYTEALLRSIPQPPLIAGERLATIPGTVPDLARLPKGCRFADRCRHSHGQCTKERPSLARVDESHYARCFLVES